MDPQLRTFNVEEAEALIPTLKTLIARLKESQARAVDFEAQIDALEIVTEKGNGKQAKELNHLIEEHHKKAAEFYATIDEIHGHGCILKDVENGLIDFYTVLNGKVVYLCWKLGEEKITHWHEVGKGFSSREPLTSPPQKEN